MIALVLLLPANSLAQDRATRIDILAEEFWPYSFSTSDSAEPQGVFIDFAIELLEEAGLDYQLHMLPWPRVMRRAASDPNQLVITVIRSEDRENLLHWVGQVADVTHALYGLDTMNPVPRTVEDARSLSIATVVDDVASNYLERNGFSNLTRTSNHLRGLELLVRGRVDLYPGNSLLINYQCVQIPRGCENLTLVLPLTDLEQELYFALSLGTDRELVELIRDHFNTLIARGRLDILEQEFLQAQSPESLPD